MQPSFVATGDKWDTNGLRLLSSTEVNRRNDEVLLGVSSSSETAFAYDGGREYLEAPEFLLGVLDGFMTECCEGL